MQPIHGVTRESSDHLTSLRLSWIRCTATKGFLSALRQTPSRSKLCISHLTLTPPQINTGKQCSVASGLLAGCHLLPVSRFAYLHLLATPTHNRKVAANTTVSSFLSRSCRCASPRFRRSCSLCTSRFGYSSHRFKACNLPHPTRPDVSHCSKKPADNRIASRVVSKSAWRSISLFDSDNQ